MQVREEGSLDQPNLKTKAYLGKILKLKEERYSEVGIPQKALKETRFSVLTKEQVSLRKLIQGTKSQ